MTGLRATARATRTAWKNPQDEHAQLEAYGMLFREVARNIRRGAYRHGADCLRLLEQGAPWLKLSKAQLHQDIWVLHETAYRQAGFFVEFGAASGVDLSNTWLLEKHFGWTGILAEPNPTFHDSLRANRSCTLDFDCVYTRTGEMVGFGCAEIGENSGIGLEGHQIDVPTVSLDDLLDRHDAPAVIDYLSVDTEGSELAILSAFNFDKRDVRLISVEHNNRPTRADLQELLVSKGYRQRFREISVFDDWYAKA